MFTSEAGVPAESERRGLSSRLWEVGLELKRGRIKTLILERSSGRRLQGVVSQKGKCRLGRAERVRAAGEARAGLVMAVFLGKTMRISNQERIWSSGFLSRGSKPVMQSPSR